MVAEKTPRKTELVFFRNNAGGEPVREWLKGLGVVERRAIGTDLLRAQWRWPIGMPLCRPMGQGLWEVRTDLPGNPRRVYWFAFTTTAWWHCMDSSRKRGPRPGMT